ncbi:MAG: hypothetical protein L0Y66_21060 [Myxococcaceae bacterium]|nr:hypothetical protein [Myxococcaceae bacterium]
MMRMRRSLPAVVLAVLFTLGCGGGDFSVWTASKNVTVTAGDPLELELHVSRGPFFREPITVQLKDAPAGIVAEPVVLEPGTDSLQMPVDVDFTLAAGTYTLTLEGTAAGKSVLADVTLEVKALEPVVAANTRILPEEARSALTSYTPDGVLLFASDSAFAAALAPGHVLVSAPAPAAPSGFLRKVTAVERLADGTWKVSSEQAMLTDAVVQASWHVQRELTPDDVTQAEFRPGVRAASRAMAGASKFEVSVNVILVDVDGKEATTDDQLRATGMVRFNVNLDLGASVRPRWGLPPWRIHAKAEASLDERVELQVVGNGVLSLEKEVGLASYAFSPIVVMAGPVPLVFVPRLTLLLGGKGELRGEVSWGFVQAFDMGAGASYDGKFHNLNRFNRPSVDVLPLQLGASAKLQAYASGRFQFYLYDLVGPAVSLRAFLDLEGQVPRRPLWSLHAGLQGDVGLHMPVLDLHYDATLLSERWSVADAPNQPPRVSILSPAPGGTVNYGGFGMGLRASVVDPEEGDTCCTITWSSDRDGVLGTGRELTYVFATPGARRLTVTATDTNGLSTPASADIVATNTQPQIVLRPPGGSPAVKGLPFQLVVDVSDVNEIGVNLCPNVSWSSNVAGDPTDTGCTATLVFPEVGQRTVTATVTDSLGASTPVSIVVDVGTCPGPAPCVSIYDPPAGELDGRKGYIPRANVEALGKTIVSDRWAFVWNGEEHPMAPYRCSGSPPFVICQWYPVDQFTGAVCGTKNAALRFYATTDDGQTGVSADHPLQLWMGPC